MSNPDYRGYTKALEAIREGLLRDYWAGILDNNRTQVSVGRNYLWVSAALVGAYVAAFDRFRVTLVSSPCLQTLGAFSFLLAAFAFGVCMYAIPVRKGYRAIPTRGWGEFSYEAYDLLKKNTPNLYATFLSSHIAKIDLVWAHNVRANRERAKLLRFASWLLIASFVLAVTVGIIIVVDPVAITKMEDIQMSNENTKPEVSTPEPKPSEESELKVPKPPPSADIGGGNTQTHQGIPKKIRFD